ncbi:tRNA lysidine(34) synthetase TilS [Denitratisoma sp. DHT3]|nr:tRNA lysidine(34) synthetase TilS [Denitratisoma sp. DHT3]
MASSRNKHSIDALPQVVSQCLARHLNPGQHLVVALSGGLDSVVLTHLLDMSRRTPHALRLSAVYINHGLSPDADAWRRHCEQCCADWDIPFQSIPVQVVRDGGDGLEGAARRARYEALSRIAADWVALAHHRDDQAETLLLNLLRGTGPVGAGAMVECTGKFLRPLLSVPREQLRQYAEHHGLRWVEDGSNRDNALRRNYLRNEILPRLDRHFSAASENLARAATRFRVSATLLAELAEQDLGDEKRLPVATLRRLSSDRAANLLFWYLRWHGVRVRKSEELSQFLRQLSVAAPDAEPCMMIGDVQVRRYRDAVWVVPPLSAADSVLLWQGEGRLPWMGGEISIRQGAGGLVSGELIGRGQVSFRLRRGGERFQPWAGRPSRPLKDWLRERGIPPWIRSRLPLMYCDEELIWVPGVGVAAKYRNIAGDSGIELEFSGLTW